MDQILSIMPVETSAGGDLRGRGFFPNPQSLIIGGGGI